MSDCIDAAPPERNFTGIFNGTQHITIISMFDSKENYFMRTKTATAILVWIMFLALTGYPSESSAETSVNINIGSPLPHVVIHEPPRVVVIPGTYAYFVPDAGPDIFFYRGYWYRPHHGQWYRARGYNGPWKKFKKHKVPYVLRDLPPDFHHRVRYHRRIQYVDLKKNWRTWEQKRHWEKHDYWHEGRKNSKGGKPKSSPDRYHDYKKGERAHDGEKWKSSQDKHHDYKKGERAPDVEKRKSSPDRHDFEKEVKEARSMGKESHPSRYGGKGERDNHK